MTTMYMCSSAGVSSRALARVMGADWLFRPYLDTMQRRSVVVGAPTCATLLPRVNPAPDPCPPSPPLTHGSQALAHFESLGYRCPEHYNPAEFLADLISLDFASPEAEAESRWGVHVERETSC